MFQAGIKLIGKIVSGTAGSGAEGAAALDHEIINDPVKGEAVIVTATGPSAGIREFLGTFGKTDKVRYCQRCHFKFKLQDDVPFRGDYFCIHSIGKFRFSCHEFSF